MKQPPLTWITLAALSVVLLLFCLLSDYLVAVQPTFSSSIWGLYDNIAHGIIGVLVLYPLAGESKIRHIIITYLLAALLDVDHIFAAGSFSVSAMMALPLRPFTHSFTFALAVALIAMVAFKKQKSVFYIVFAALASHVLRDASSGLTPFLYPLDVLRIPYWVYLAGEVVLLFISFSLSKTLRTYGTH